VANHVVGYIFHDLKSNEFISNRLHSPTRTAFWGIGKIPYRAQFYNIIGCVDSEKFIYAFTKWMQKVVQGDVAGKILVKQTISH